MLVPVDRCGLAFQYQVNKIIKQNGQKQLQIKILCKCIKAKYKCPMAAYAAHTTI